MAKKIENPSFERWLQYVFEQNSEWDENTEEYYVSAEDPCRTVDYIQRLFASPAEHTASYSNCQVGQGFNYLINLSESGEFLAVFDPQISPDTRIAIIKSIYNIFEQVFAIRHSPRVNDICFMWWGTIPLYGKSGDPVHEVLDSYCLDVMEQTLCLQSIACQEGALHGLGHWAFAYPERVQSIIDEFLGKHPDIPERLRDYALKAREGRVQ